MPDGLSFRRAAAKEIARQAGIVNRLRLNRDMLRRIEAHLKDVAHDYPRSFALSLAIVDCEEVIEHLDQCIRAAEANPNL